ncbi:MAG: hypothetical protein AB8G14_13290 [Ilumatobacter sp.]
MPKRLSGGTLITATTMLAACGTGSGDTTGTDPSLVSDAITTVSTTTIPVEIVDSEPPTSAAATSAPTTVTTAPAPTTTEQPVEEQVAVASLRVYDLYWSCLRAPNDCDIASGYLPGSDAFGALTNTVNDLSAGGLYVGEEDVGYQVIESVEVKEDHTAVTSCWWATGVLYLLPPIEGAEATIQNDRTETARQVDEFVQDPDDGEWKIRRSDQIELVEDENTCPPEQ